MDEKDTLHRYLRSRRQHLRGKLDGLGEYDIRRPMVPSGTNLLGLVKHVASVELEYFGDCFGRPSGRVLPWSAEDAEPDSDLWATSDETRAEILDLHDFAARHTDATIEALDLDATGEVPWWPPERRIVTLHQVLVHMCVETAHHAGHADIIRELIDGSVGRDAKDPSLAHRTATEWTTHYDRIQAAAEQLVDRPHPRS